MEVGKKYRRTFGDGVSSLLYICVAMTPGGNAVMSVSGHEAMVRTGDFHLYQEMIEPVVRYIHWYRRNNDGDILAITLKTEVTPVWMNRNQSYTHLKTERIEYRG